jgi:hypothetical protein
VSEEETDIVYLWCDAADPAWRAKRAACAERHGIRLASSGNGDCRTRGNDDLRYALRSLCKCAPWVRRVLLVVDDDNRPPEWLDLGNPRLRVVRLSEFMPSALLPCYSSDTIEHHLWNIEGLAERFLLANDDMMFYRPVDPGFFYAPDGFPYCRFGGPKHEGDLRRFTVYRTNLANSARILQREYGCGGDLALACSHYPHHNVDAYLRNDVRECFEKFKSDLLPTFELPFREPRKFQRFLYSGYAIAVGHAHYKVARAHATPHRPWWKRLLVHGWADSLQFVGRNWRVAERELRRYNPALFCCNDTEETAAEDIEAMKATYERLFPSPSEFERGRAT